MNNKKSNNNQLLMTLLKGRTFIVLVLLVIFFTIVKGTTFLSASTLTMVAKNVALYGILALGMTFVIITGGIDLSVGSVVAMDCMILAVGIEQWGWTSPVLMLFILAIGIVFGVVQGFCISYLEIQPFIVTMAGMFFARGMTAVICKEQVSIVSDKILPLFPALRFPFPLEGI